MVGIPGSDWHVQYRRHDADHVEWFPTPERAVEAACGFMDDGCEVYGIGCGMLDNSIGKDRIASIYALWVKAKLPSK
ncbi:MAG: hypothetical protein WB647_00910 [Roseiarcus sp.]|uniref:hypothetical protein n=1 Tax=Roseiarcus sp. TaxID=1969460 RepID=UPI003C5B5722